MIDTPFDNRRYIGVEDIRIRNTSNNQLMHIGTGFHKNCELGIVTGIYDIVTNKLEINEIKPNFNNASCEKNWVFVKYEGNEHLVYKWYPLQI
jgi:hypothetical protein